MKIEGDNNSYILRLSARETTAWASSWPCSTIAGKPLMVAVDSNGLYDLNKAVGDPDGHELDAIVSDFLPNEYRHLWPVWGKSTL